MGLFTGLDPIDFNKNKKKNVPQLPHDWKHKFIFRDNKSINNAGNFKTFDVTFYCQQSQKGKDRMESNDHATYT